MTKSVLKVEHLCAWYGRAQILFDLDLHLAQGEVVALLGRNGAGKSTLLKSLMGLVQHRQGSVRLFERSIEHWPTHEIARAGLGYVPQERRIFTSLTVLENLQLAQAAPRHWPDGQEAPHWTIEALFDHFPNLASLQNRLGGQISGGEQQMLSLARTLMGNPLVLLLDEPSEGIAPIIVQRMLDMVLALKETGVSILLSEQNIGFAQAASDRVYFLEQGHIHNDDSADRSAQAFERYERYLGSARRVLDRAQ
jgi:branched-chain amino acid transport system ATP-binding protein